MLVLGIETSCDECSFALVDSGKTILAHVTKHQIDVHRSYKGVVPELASRRHIEMILPVFEQTMSLVADNGIVLSDIDGIGVSNRPGLSGSLSVGLSFAKGLSFAINRPFVGIDHILAHLYAPKLEFSIDYPYLGLLVSGGHSMIVKVQSYDSIDVMGSSIDDACGEAFDKVACYFNFDYPGGQIIDQLAAKGFDKAFNFPFANLQKHGKNYDVSYSGLKNAVINQREMFWDGRSEKSLENICASFQRVAIDSILKKLEAAMSDSGIHSIVAGGGVAANSYLRARLASWKNARVYFPSIDLCTDNGAMVAGLAYEYLKDNQTHSMDLSVSARVLNYRKTVNISKK